MPSPFPGMNPYLEQDEVWQDFHDALVPVMRDAISPQVSPHFIVKIEEHLYIHEPDGTPRVRVGSADVGLIRPGGAADSPNGATATLTAPERVVLPQVDLETQTFLEIRDRKSRELVTVIELLSPTNKRPGPDREQYLAKRGNVLRSSAHFVEIDLLRGWPRMPCAHASACDYCVTVSRVEERPTAGFWPIRLRDRLPIIPIPLREPVREARLDLQELVHLVYDRAYYKDYVYQGVPHPPLGPDDATWAQALVPRP
jgi:Protein of unknown function (DUF4058)